MHRHTLTLFAPAKTIRFPLCWLAILFVLSGCAGDGTNAMFKPADLRGAPKAPAPETPEVANVTRTANYVLRPGDTLRIAVFGQDDLSGEYQIDAGGVLTFPLIGELAAEGKTVPEIRALLRQRLDADYLVDPKVSAEILNYRPVFILGEIEDPGRYDYELGLTVRSAVALSGGFTRRARTNLVGIVRRGADGKLTTYQARPDSAVLPGDTIEVYRRLF